jgi:hypothetical protein
LRRLSSKIKATRPDTLWRIRSEPKELSSIIKNSHGAGLSKIRLKELLAMSSKITSSEPTEKERICGSKTD